VSAFNVMLGIKAVDRSSQFEHAVLRITSTFWLNNLHYPSTNPSDYA
jgi:hypothetical protein